MGKKDELAKNPYGGLFIVFEGPSGNGKSTHTKLLARNLEEKLGLKRGNIVLTAEPTDSFVGGRIREILKGELNVAPENLKNLFLQDRFSHLVNKIIPALRVGKIVISDRYHHSTIVHQSLALGFDPLVEEFVYLNQNHGFILPDITIILKVSVAELIRRRTRRQGKKQMFEDEKKLKAILDAYDRLAEISFFKDWLYLFEVSGEEPIEELAEDIFALVKIHPKLRRVKALK